MCRNPFHLVEVKENISKVQPTFAVEILVDPVAIRIVGLAGEP
jgi:hypothetical protein